MAYEYKVNRVTLSGTCFSGTEIWSTGFYMGFENADVPPPTATSGLDVATAWKVFWANALSKVSNKYFFDHVKIQHFNADGTQDLANLVDYYEAAPVAANGGTGAIPAQLTIVASLRSSLARGLASKGRMYLPGVNIPISDLTGKISANASGDLNTTLQTFMDAVNADPDIPGHIILASKGRTVAPTAPPNNKLVETVAIGDVYDTQRRRRNGLIEVYTTRPITSA